MLLVWCGRYESSRSLDVLLMDTGYAQNSSSFFMAHASAVLQKPDHGRIPPAVGPVACAQRLLWHGKTARRISWRAPDIQPSAFSGGPASGLCIWRGTRPVS